MRVIGLFLALIFFAFGAGQLDAKDYVASKGALSDAVFYPLVACGAKPGQPCRHAMVHWPDRELSVGFAEIDRKLDEPGILAARRALQNAIDEINRSGAGITLRFVNTSPDIHVFLSAEQHVRRHKALLGVQRDIGRRPIGATRIFFEDYEIRKAVVVIAARRGTRVVTSVVLEEITQALGLPTDIKSEYYRSRSIFSEDNNRLTSLGAQDVRVLRLHYPLR